ncbi:adenylate/guanylate cyclase domain-containing protein [Marinobacterium rhizophilum]|uniref:AAA family ATPase n=1 Tax=Marinobacterium rhizophilum TaxID=420402 RepID=A0ABY5HMR6_9GAMM|nr:adenylate/guanylate cyclase domain-containing protein [Marinobacterium rhizophilum]UTW13166.1 AAA family ATPase [Marinobacterium rhizophilum]
MRCAGCGFDNPRGAKFCNQCGAALAPSCPRCGHALRVAAKFCDDCGAPLAQTVTTAVAPAPAVIAPIHYTPRHLAERIIAEQAALRARGGAGGERKIVTALFADMAGSTALIQGLDPEQVRNLIDPILGLMMEAVHHYEGYVAKSLGDGILALFGAPIAHEDHPQRALYAALRMQESMQRYADRVRLEQEIPLQIRVGIHTGEVVLRSIHTEDLRADYEPVGQSIHLASRMEGLATPGSIVVSEATRRLAEGYFEFKALGAIPVKGIAQPLDVYEVLGSGPLRTRLQVAARRGLAPFVGRQSELGQLGTALSRVRHTRGQVVGVVGEPGVGKSRLFYEFRPRAQQDCRVLETFSVSHGKAFAYLPLVELLKTYLQISPQDDDRCRREKITGKVLTLDRRLEDSLPYLFYLLGLAEASASLAQMDSQLRRQRTFEAIRRLLLRESVNQPLLVIFEDLQWLDNETAAFLDYLVDGITHARLLLLVNYRPEYRHDWGQRPNYTQLRLEPLGRAEAEVLLGSLLGNDPTLAAIKPLIMAQTDGNPFFLEEVVQTLVEEAVLLGEPGHYRLQRAPEALQIPTTVQGVLSARIDRLQADEKALLQTLAVIGKEFPWSLVLQVVELAEQPLRQRLSRLQAGEFLYERPAFPEVEYSFKHGLTQEVAYGSVLKDRRTALHERTARALEALFPEQREERCNELAHHYSCSGNVPKAVEYLQRAGEQALHRCANGEAVEHLGAALERLEQLPDTPERQRQELGLQLALGPVWMAIRGYAAAEVEATYRRALELSQHSDDVPAHFTALFGLDAYYLVGGELQAALDMAEQLLQLAEREQDTDFLLEAYGSVGVVLLPLGELAPARDRLEQGAALYDPEQHRAHAFLYGLDPGVLCLCYLAFTLQLMGASAQARAQNDAALALAQQLGHPVSLAFALDFAAELHQLCGEGEQVLARAEAAIELSCEQGFSFWLAHGRVLQGWALAAQGDSDAGIEQIRQGLVAYRATGAEMFMTHLQGLLADALVRAGKTAEALSVLDEALALVETTRERFYEAELYRLRGECLADAPVSPAAGKGASATPESCFLQAIKLARGQGARLLEWRAMLSLAQLRIQQSRAKEARELLDMICKASPEADGSLVTTAKTLLEKLDGAG